MNAYDNVKQHLDNYEHLSAGIVKKRIAHITWQTSRSVTKIRIIHGFHHLLYRKYAYTNLMRHIYIYIYKHAYIYLSYSN